MPDVAALHAAIISTADAVSAAGPTVVGYRVVQIVVSICFFLFMTGLGVVFIKSCDSSLNPVGALAITSGICVLVVGIGSGIPRQGPSKETLQAREDACSDMLGSVRSGQVRWMQSDWQRDVINVCGSNRFAAAANAPGSVYAAR